MTEPDLTEADLDQAQNDYRAAMDAGDFDASIRCADRYPTLLAMARRTLAAEARAEHIRDVLDATADWAIAMSKAFDGLRYTCAICGAELDDDHAVGCSTVTTLDRVAALTDNKEAPNE